MEPRPFRVTGARLAQNATGMPSSRSMRNDRRSDGERCAAASCEAYGALMPIPRNRGINDFLKGKSSMPQTLQIARFQAWGELCELSEDFELGLRQTTLMSSLDENRNFLKAWR